MMMNDKQIIQLEKNELKSVAESCTTRGQFLKAYGMQYKRASELGILDDICSHMDVNKNITRAYLNVTNSGHSDLESHVPPQTEPVRTIEDIYTATVESTSGDIGDIGDIGDDKTEPQTEPQTEPFVEKDVEPIEYVLLTGKDEVVKEASKKSISISGLFDLMGGKCGNSLKNKISSLSNILERDEFIDVAEYMLNKHGIE